MQVITIASIEERTSKKDATKKYYIIKDQKGAEMSAWDGTVTVLKPGDVIECEVEVSGKYVNLRSWQKRGGVAPTPTVAPGPTVAQVVAVQQAGNKPYSDNREFSIESQVAAKIVAELWQSKTLPDNSPEIAGLRHWLISRLPAPADWEKPVKTSPPVQAVTQEPSKAPTGQEGASTGKKSGLPDTVKDSDAMAKIVKAQGKTLDNLLAFLGIGSPSDIKVVEDWQKVKKWLEGV